MRLYMGCFTEALKAPHKNDIICKESKQKYIIEFILTHSRIDLNDLAQLVNVNVIELSHVLAGKSLLPKEASSLLSQWFVLMLEE